MSIQKVRSITGAGMLACKSALEDANGDVDKAVEALRKKGLVKALSKADRVTNEGVISVALKDNEYALVEINCETDFVAKNEEFGNFTQALSKTLLDGNMDTFEKDIDETLKSNISKFGENLVVSKYEKAASSNKFEAYIHANKKLVVIVEYSGEANKVRNVAMHIAALNPLGLDENSINPEELAKEREIYREELKDKPAHVVDRIIEGKIAKFLGESVLLKQNFVKDSSQTVEQYLGDTKIHSFKRFVLGAN